jgi:hypothetical protein
VLKFGKVYLHICSKVRKKEIILLLKIDNNKVCSNSSSKKVHFCAKVVKRELGVTKSLFEKSLFEKSLFEKSTFLR